MDAQVELLQKILNHADKLQRLSQITSLPITDLSAESHPPVTVRSPPISQDLCELGIPQEVVKLLEPSLSVVSTCYVTCLRNNMDVVRTHFRAAIKGLPPASVVINHTFAIFESEYRSSILPALHSSILQRMSRTQTSYSLPSNRVPDSFDDDDEMCKPQFNNTFRPYLEKYFQYNAFPSRADQEHLARKSMMTRRQIEVFFQNRRRRWREAGKELPQRHPTDPLPVELNIEKWVQEATPGLSEMGGKADSNPGSVSASSSTTKEPDILATWSSPSSAFPSKVPSEQVAPWWERPREILPLPIWMRQPVSTEPNHEKTTIGELKRTFLRCLDWPVSSKKGKQSKSYRDTAREPAVRAITVVPPPAPLPALVPSHSPLLKQPQKPKKISGLPKRRPKHPPVGHKAGQSVTPPSAHTFSFSASSVAAFSSRTPSLESDCSSTTTSSSSSLQRQTSLSSLRSNGSSSSDGTPPSTPPDSSIALPGTASSVVLPTQFSLPMKPPSRQATPAISVAGTDDHLSLFGDSNPLQELFEGTATVLDSTTCGPSHFGQLPSIDTGLGDLNALFGDIENPLNFFSNWDLTAPIPSHAEFSYAF